MFSDQEDEELVCHSIFHRQGLTDRDNLVDGQAGRRRE